MSLSKAKQAEQSKPERPKETPPESVAGIASVLVVGLFILTFVVQHFEIPSSSMEKTLLIGDHVFVDRLIPMGKGPLSWLLPYRDLKRGDTAVFLTPNPAEPGLHLVKRIVAGPGDRIHLHNGTLSVNGERQVEPYVVPSSGDDPYRDDFPSISPYTQFQIAEGWAPVMLQNINNGELVVPADSYFAMGHNRGNSLDSRYWGFVPKKNVIGRPLLIFWSFNVPGETTEPKPVPDRIASFLHTTMHFFGLTRWNRVFRLVH